MKIKTKPNRKVEWTALYLTVPTMSLERCSEILDANKRPHNAIVLLDYRKEVVNLCIDMGANQFGW
jgi:hypothetical protein